MCIRDRYIAIMDNIDTAKGISDLVPMQDLFNEWHAKNTSDKVRKAVSYTHLDVYKRQEILRAWGYSFCHYRRKR